MSKYIALLRGINVGGRRKILMADLKALFSELGFSNMKTFIQSGNVLFEAEKEIEPQSGGLLIQEAIHKQYGFEVPVLLRSIEEFKRAFASNPFLNDPDVNQKRLHLTFLADIPSPANLARLKEADLGSDRYHIIGKDVFIYCAGKYSDSKLSNKLFESKLKVSATTRNWKTVGKLLELVSCQV